MRLTWVIVISYWVCSIAYAQDNVNKKLELIFDPTFKGKIFHAGDTINVGGNDIIPEKIKFYLSNIQFHSNGKIVWEEGSSYHLLNLFEPEKNVITMEVPGNIQYNEMIFSLGIDSATNTSGVMGGDLDPTNGMYWTWQSGYINVKIEGYCSACPTRNHFFEFHLGGYQFPFKSVQTIRINTSKHSTMHIGFDLEKFFGQTDLEKRCAVMSPCNEAVQLSLKAANSFYLRK